jgi:hypothetical protein
LSNSSSTGSASVNFPPITDAFDIRNARTACIDTEIECIPFDFAPDERNAKNSSCCTPARYNWSPGHKPNVTMPHAAPLEIWSEAQVAARFDALKRSAPALLSYVIFRCTTTASGTETSAYRLPGQDGPQATRSFEDWLIRHRLAAADRLGVSVLVIRETLDTGGAIRDCTLERRHGGVAGPFSATRPALNSSEPPAGPVAVRAAEWPSGGG